MCELQGAPKETVSLLKFVTAVYSDAESSSIHQSVYSTWSKATVFYFTSFYVEHKQHKPLSVIQTFTNGSFFWATRYTLTDFEIAPQFTHNDSPQTSTRMTTGRLSNGNRKRRGRWSTAGDDN